MSTSEDNGTDSTDAGASRLSSETSGAAEKAKGATKAGASKVEAAGDKAAEKAAAGASAVTGAGKKAAGKAKDAAKGTDAKVSRRGTKKRQDKPMKIDGANPTWWVPVMLGLMVVGLIWIVVFYLTQGKAPLPIGKEGDGARYWNLAIGFGLIMVGFVMTTRWK